MGYLLIRPGRAGLGSARALRSAVGILPARDPGAGQRLLLGRKTKGLEQCKLHWELLENTRRRGQQQPKVS